ncbi:MAG TPA: FtsX-like permease family protein [Lentimicrobium sp.]|nr:FtsX-like permease family protein [Lentimicrobium sp.]
MFTNYILSAIRNLKKNRFYSFINILGLSLGITAAAFILLYITEEMGYDKHFKNHETIYRLESDFSINGKHDKFAVTAMPLGQAYKLEMPEVRSFARFIQNDNEVIKYGNKEFYEKKAFLADSTAPEMFSLDFIEGSPAKSLTQPFTVIISESVAKKYFGDQPAYGKTVISGDKRSYKVTGVFKDLPHNTHMPFDILMSMESLATIVGKEQFRSLDPERFWNVNTYTFIKVDKPEDIEIIKKNSQERVYNKYMKSVGDQLNATFSLMATRLDQIHHTTKLGGDFPAGNKSYLYLMGLVGFMILILAAINYMNLATARATKRAREIGLRKVSGADRLMLAWQFITESLVLSIIALIISFGLIQLLLPFFNDMADKQLKLEFFTNPQIYLLITAIAILVGLLSGVYPALYLSSFQPSNVLKGKINIGRQSSWLRKGLVTFQLIISVIMITGTIIIYNQLSFMRNADLGFEKENVMVVTVQDTTFLKKIKSFRDELKENPNVIQTALSFAVPGGGNGVQLMKVEKDGQMKEFVLNTIGCDQEFADLLGLEFVEGRNFDRANKTDDTAAVIVNEAAVRALEWGDKALGKRINRDFDINGKGGHDRKVIGVVKDFHFTSLHNKVEPMMLFIPNFPMNVLSIRLKPGSGENTINYIKSKWESFGNDRPFDYYFLDENFDNKYSAEAKLGKVFASFAILSIIIALMGLLGLSSFVTAQRTKEIGIRKVLGASMEGIIGLLYKESLILVLIACGIALPVSYYLISNWLDNYAYHIPLTWVSFLLSTLTAIIVCLASVSYHTLTAANSNPVKSIKYE